MTIAARRIARWRWQSPFQDGQLFADRMSSPTLDQRTFERVLGTPSAYLAKHNGSELEWLTVLHDVYSGLSAHDLTASGASASYADPRRTMPLTRPLARVIHEGRLMSLSSGRIEPVMARGGADDASFGFPALTRGDFGTAMSA